LAALDALEADAEAVAGRSFDALSERDCVTVAERLNRVARKVSGVQYEVVNQLSERAVPADIGGPLPRVLADRLTIRPGAARRLINDAHRLGHRRAMSGQRLAPLWPATAAQVRAGAVGAEHVAVIGEFFHQLPAAYPAEARERDEQLLGAMAAQLRPDQLQKAADRMAALINPTVSFPTWTGPASAAFPGAPKVLTR